MKENCRKEFLDLRKFDEPINSLDLIKSITSNPLTENDPFYIADLEDICNKHINWITKLPRVEPHYAIKCNTDPMLLKLLAYLGTGFDCASKNEIQTMLDLGVQPERIIFANPCKQASNVRYAYKHGVDQMTFDNEDELYKIKANHPNAKCVLRIITNDEDAICKFSMKFGADMATAHELVDLAMQLGLNLIGISFHVGSGQMEPSIFSESIANARTLFDYAAEKHSCKMHLLDLGGGFTIDLFDKVALGINKTLDDLFPKESGVRVIAEPGRYYAASAFTLCVNVIAKRTVRQNAAEQSADKSDESLDKVTDSTKSFMYYINDSVYGSFNCMFYDHTSHTPVVLKDHTANEDKNIYKSSIWGPTCDGLDCISPKTQLPELEVGEFLAFEEMGAYTMSGAVAFNGIPLPRCIYVASQSWDTIKDAFNDQLENPLINAVTKNAPLLASICATAAYQSVLFASNQVQDDQESSGAVNKSGRKRERHESIKLEIPQD